MLKISSVIVHKKAGHDVPPAYLAEMLKNNTSLIAVIAAKGGKLHSTLQKEMPTAEGFDKEMSPGIKDLDAMIFAAGSNEAIPAEQYQPYVLLQNTDDEPILLAFLEGNFRTSKDSNVILQWSDVANMLQEKVKDLYDTCEDDLGKLLKLLDKPSQRKDIEGLYGVRGAVILMANDGTILRYASAGKEFDWGYVTQTYDYNPETKKEEKAEKPKKGAFALFGGGEEETSKSEMPEKVPTETAAKESSVVDKGLTVEDVNAQTETSVPLMVRIPDRIWNKVYKEKHGKRNAVRGWYQKYFGNNFGDWAQRPSFPITQLKKPLEGEDAKDSIIKPTAAEVAEQTGAATEVKEVDKYILSAKAKEDIGEYLKGLDVDKRVVANPQDIQSKEEKYPSFCEQNGIHLEDTFGWTVDDFETLGLKSLEGLALLAMEYRAKYYGTLKMEDLTGTTKKEEPAVNTEAANDKPAEPEKKVAAGGGAFSMFR